MKPIQHQFWRFIEARDAMRRHRESGAPPPHSDDTVLAAFHFCNVNREHDRVTRWIDTHVRKKYHKRPLAFMTLQLTIARVFNEPTVLPYLLPWCGELQQFEMACARAKAEQKKLLRGAYMVPAHGSQSTAMSIPRYYGIAFLELEKALRSVTYKNTTTLAQVAEVITSVKGFADFMANQVCTDLRYVFPGHWRDYSTFVLAGAGTRRGLNRYYGRDLNAASNFTAELWRIREHDAPNKWKLTFHDINNLSNCFCEFDKYQRAVDQVLGGEVPHLKRKYHGNHNS